MTTATINGKVVAYPSTLGEITSLYSRLDNGEAIVIQADGLEIERHIKIDGEVVAQECGVDYDA